MIEQLLVLGSYRDKELEAIVVKNGGGKPLFYKVSVMDFDELKDYLSSLNKETSKI